jgi:V/A-type H+-transporting ATPase subunit C
MEKLIFDLEVKNLFRIPFDFHNMKVLLKGRFNEMEVTDTLSDFGTISITEMKTAFDTENFNPLPEFMRETIGQALADHYLKKDIKSMEFLIDNLEYSYLLSLSKKTTIPFLINYVKIKIDLANISTILRVKYFDTEDNLEETLIERGNFSTIFFLKLSGESLESLPILFRSSPYYKLIDMGVKKILENGSFSILDRESENFIMNYIRLTRYLTFGVEPVAAYFISREQDLNTIKMILVGKLNELPTTEIRNRIPQTFN